MTSSNNEVYVCKRCGVTFVLTEIGKKNLKGKKPTWCAKCIAESFKGAYDVARD